MTKSRNFIILLEDSGILPSISALAKAFGFLGFDVRYVTTKQFDSLTQSTAAYNLFNNTTDNDVILMFHNGARENIEDCFLSVTQLRCPPIGFPGLIIVVYANPNPNLNHFVSTAALKYIGTVMLGEPLSITKFLNTSRTHKTYQEEKGYSLPSRNCRPVWSIAIELAKVIHDIDDFGDNFREFLTIKSGSLTAKERERLARYGKALKICVETIRGAFSC